MGGYISISVATLGGARKSIFTSELDIRILHVYISLRWNLCIVCIPENELELYLEEMFSFYFHCRVFSEASFLGVHEKLIEHLFSVIFHITFEVDIPCMTNQVKEALRDIIDWFSTPEGTYIRCYGFQISPHLMSRYVTNNIVMQEVEN